MAGNGNQKGESALVAGLAAGMTIKDAAAAAGIGERTAHRRLEDAAFRQEVADARAAMVDRAVGQMADAATEAVTTLRALLGADAESVRLGAARSIIELGSRLREEGDLAERLRRVEALLVLGAPPPTNGHRAGEATAWSAR